MHIMSKLSEIKNFDFKRDLKNVSFLTFQKRGQENIAPTLLQPVIKYIFIISKNVKLYYKFLLLSYQDKI